MALNQLELSPWTIRFTQWILVQLVTGLTVAFEPTKSYLRPAATAVVISLAYSFQSQVRRSSLDTRAGGPLAAMCWVNVMNAIDLMLLSRVSYDAQLEWERKKAGNSKERKLEVDRKNTRFRRLIWAIEIAFNYRRISTPWQIKKAAAFDINNPEYVPCRSKFLRQCVLKLCASFAVMQLFTIDPRHPHLASVLSQLSPGMEVLVPFLAGYTVRRLLIQALFTMAFGFVTKAGIVGTYSLGAIISVGLGISEPVDWPPMIGSLTEAWSLARFWGTAWHQILRKPLTAPTDFVLFCLLRLSPSPLVRSIRVLLVFALSGTIHLFMDNAFGVSLHKSGAIWFFCLSALGIVLESIVQDIFRGVTKQVSSRWSHIIGYVWVSLFFLWATPVWINPILLQLYEDGQRLPSPMLVFHSLPVIS